MAAANGSSKPNGLSNGINGKMNGHVVHRKKVSKKSSSYLGWSFNTVSRLTAYFMIYTVLFRCPSTLESCDKTSPYVCEHYFKAKELLAPRVRPYYDQYAGPYVQVAQPYYEVVNTKILTPARQYAVQYGAPWLEKGQHYTQAKWDETIQPQLTELQAIAQKQYDEKVAPHLGQATDAISPYYEIARSNSVRVYHDQILPSYLLAQPYAAEGYQSVSKFTVNTILPAVYWVSDKTNVFLDTALWPQIRVLYVESIEPQLVRIGERLGRYRQKASGRKSESSFVSQASESLQSTLEKVTAQIPTGSVSTSPDASVTASGYDNVVKAPPAHEDESEKRRKTREMVAEDLALWQNKFTAKADEGAADMEERISEITQHMVSEQVQGLGRKTVSALKTSIQDAVTKLKTEILSIVGAGADDDSSSEESTVQAIRASASGIKESYQEIRDWREKYDSDLESTVVQAAETHFQILDEIRSLALQHIGQKWAWADGVTYKDWAKYHELKSTLTQWTEQLKERIVSHPTLLEAQEAARQLEDEGMELAADAAKELTRLKEVAHYKILASDTTESFELEIMKQAAEVATEAKRTASIAAQKAKEAEEAAFRQAQEAQTIATQKAKAAQEAALKEAENVASAAQDTAETVTISLVSAAKEASSSASSVADAAGSTGSSIVSGASEAVASGSTFVEDGVESASNAASQTARVATDSVSSGYSSASTVVDSVVSNASSAATEASSQVAAAAEKIIGDGTSEPQEAADQIDPVIDGASLVIDEDIMTVREETPPSDTPSVKPAFFGGAMAQKVSGGQPILDDYVDTDFVSSATEAAQKVYSNAVSRASDQYSSALSVVSAQIYGTPQPVHEQLFGSVSEAYEKALAAASDRLKNAKEAAVAGIYGAPTPTAPPKGLEWAKVESIAAQRLNEGRLWAELQYSSALIALGVATATPTPSSLAEKYVQQAKVNYYAGIGLAQERYSSFMSAASAAFSSATATPTPTDFAGTASSIASVARESAASAASAAGEAAEAAYVAATGTLAAVIDSVEGTVNSALEGAAEQVYLAGSSVAKTWDSAVNELNNRIYGGVNPMIGWYDGLMSDANSAASSASNAVTQKATSAAGSASTASAAAKQQYEAVTKLISELINGKEPSFTDSVLSRLGAAYATAAASVEILASGVSSAASGATEVVKETIKKVRDEL